MDWLNFAKTGTSAGLFLEHRTEASGSIKHEERSTAG